MCLAWTLCKYDLRKGNLFVLGWARVRWGSLSLELLMCGGGVRSILLLPLVARCLETIYVCIWRMFVFMSVVVTVTSVPTAARRHMTSIISSLAQLFRRH